MTTFLVVVLGIVGIIAVCVLMCVSLAQFFDGSWTLGALAAAAAVVITAAGITWMIEADEGADRVCVRSSVVIINNYPYSVCDEYAERVR